jgi:hypothetical protein
MLAAGERKKSPGEAGGRKVAQRRGLLALTLLSALAGLLLSALLSGLLPALAGLLPRLLLAAALLAALTATLILLVGALVVRIHHLLHALPAMRRQRARARSVPTSRRARAALVTYRTDASVLRPTSLRATHAAFSPAPPPSRPFGDARERLVARHTGPDRRCAAALQPPAHGHGTQARATRSSCMAGSRRQDRDGVSGALAAHLCAYCAVGACLAVGLYVLFQPARQPNPGLAAYKPLPGTIISYELPA